MSESIIPDDATVTSNEVDAGNMKTFLSGDVEAAHAVLGLVSTTGSDALAPIPQFPPEIFTAIFAFHMDDYEESTPWVGISHVCRYWRDVALECAQLWGRIDLSYGNQWVREMLVRAHLTPVEIYGEGDHLTISIVEFIIVHLSHIRALRLRFVSLPQGRLQMLYQGLLDSPAPIIESLSLINHHPSSLPSGLPVGVTHHAPRLRSLLLQGLGQIAWTQFSLPNIVALRIINPTMGQTHLLPLPFFDHILDFLAGLPSLESLLLKDCFPRSYEQTEPGHPGRVVDLARLQEIELIGTVSGCARLFEHLRIPPSAHRDVSCSITGTEDENLYPSVFSAFFNPLGGSSSAPLRAMSVMNYEPETSLYFAVSTESEGCVDPDWDGQARLKLVWPMRRGLMHYDLLRLAHGAIPGRGIQKLSVATTALIWNVNDWLSCFANLDGVEELYVGYEAADAICDALSTFVLEEGTTDWRTLTRVMDIEDPRRCFFLPKLSRLVLQSACEELAQPFATAVKARILSYFDRFSLRAGRCDL
ncbi:hypothetical protein BV25DRAFT_1914352 [Artomyces pyxidatus]|uniref:Uncharacterized protein n=1 Tax=Artomyces pyxidatus TaxID=48021 RepID=A0ACB8T9J6_9AGAM|nr:hypothetical protein BV25DRAFT_1914352 [Artomyces pyxidatus]